MRRDIVSGPRSRETTSFRRWLREVEGSTGQTAHIRGGKNMVDPGVLAILQYSVLDFITPYAGPGEKDLL